MHHQQISSKYFSFKPHIISTWEAVSAVCQVSSPRYWKKCGAAMSHSRDLWCYAQTDRQANTHTHTHTECVLILHTKWPLCYWRSSFTGLGRCTSYDWQATGTNCPPYMQCILIQTFLWFQCTYSGRGTYSQAILGLLNTCITSCNEFASKYMYLCVSRNYISFSIYLVYLKSVIVQQRRLLPNYCILKWNIKGTAIWLTC